jgi:signal transduction histidine kinase/putative methionine-R-sulfoxide reductase with GAF domain
VTETRLATQPRRRRNQVRALQQQLAAVRAIGATLANAVGVDALFEQIVPHVSVLMRAERSTLFLYDAAQDEIWSKVAQGEQSEIRLPAGRGIAGWVARHRVPLSVPDAYADSRFDQSFDKRTGYRTRSIAAAPITDSVGNLLGVLQVLNHDGGPFDAADLEMLEGIAIEISHAVENARLSQELIDRNRELERARRRAEERGAELDLLYDLERAIAVAVDVPELLSTVLARLCQRLGAIAASAVLAEPEGEPQLFHAPAGAAETDPAALLRLASESPPPIPGEPPRVDQPTRLAVPLSWDGRAIGALQVSFERGSDPSEHDEALRMVTLVAGQLARGIVLARERQARVQTERLAFLGRMLAGVAHDLSSPMAVLAGYAEMLTSEEDEARRRSQSQRLLRQVDQMEEMLGDLLAFARGDATLRISDLRVEQFGEEVEALLETLSRHRRIETELRATGGIARVDVGRARRIVYNLVRNAIDVLRAGDRVEVELAERAGGLAIVVADSGPGIPAEVRARMFQPFVTSGKEDGTGLGLAIVRRFVDDHGGSIQVETAPGRGTTFRVELPGLHTS